MSNICKEYQVHKFGGTSLANTDRFTAIPSLLHGKNEIIVVSATQGTTSALQLSLDNAKNKQPFLNDLNTLEKKHLDLIKTLLPHDNDITPLIKKDIAEIKDVLHAIELTGTYSREIQDLILGYGEIWSAQILTSYLVQYHQVIYLDASTVLFIYEKNGILYIDWPKSQAALEAFLKNKKFDQLVITGFIAATLQGKRTTLGRNGSDFSAAIFAHLFRANKLTIWTDVDGIYSADPTRVPSAFVIESLSYKEALELAYFGAKVLHPMTIGPALESEIPIYIKNSLNPEAPGTCISSSPKPCTYLVKGLTSIDNISLVNIEGTGMIGVSGIAARVFKILHQENISVILISQASSEHSICFAVRNTDIETAVRVLNESLQFEIERRQIDKIHADFSCAILSAVGDKMVGNIGVSGKLCNALAKANVNIRAISQGSSERNISVVIKSDDINKALQAVHAGLHLSREKISIGMIGPGQVGKALLNQLKSAAEQLKSRYRVDLCLRGIMNSKKMLLDCDKIDIEQWEQQFDQCNTEADISAFTQHILADDGSHAVIIDCTANPTISQMYLNFLEQGIHVITPNKHANAGDLNYYKKLKSITQKMNRHYLYEATVCAGLPIINTLQDLIKTGDKVEKIAGIVSGTMSFIFDELAKGRKFSEVVFEAKNNGYTEPDPREDLSGMDVARKFICLAREIGCDISINNVHVHNLVPENLRTCSIEEFIEKLPLYDNDMKKFADNANKKNEKLCYVGTIEHDGVIDIKIRSFPYNHPFSNLKGTDNMLIFHSQRYHNQPLIIQGPGAGAEVTAAGIFADLLRLISYLS